jgi:hypothetical protein
MATIGFVLIYPNALTPDKLCQLIRSTQRLLGVYSRESGNLLRKYFVEARTCPPILKLDQALKIECRNLRVRLFFARQGMLL